MAKGKVQKKSRESLQASILNDRVVLPSKTSLTSNADFPDLEEGKEDLKSHKLAKQVFRLGHELDEDVEIEEMSDDLDLDCDDEGYVNLPEDEQALQDEMGARWMATQEGAGNSLYDKVLNLLKEREEVKTIDPEIKKLDDSFISMATLLNRYKVGKLPKLLKIIARIKDWEGLLSLTNPSRWSPQATYEITKIFASHANSLQAQRYYNIFLLPAVQTCIRKKKKLHMSLYKALCKSVFKPAAWLKGILIPLAYEGCRYREAMIIGSVVSKLSFPNLDMSATLMKLLGTRPFPDEHSEDCKQWYATTSYFITIILEKKLNLPSRVVQEFFVYMRAFEGLDERPPLVWYQSLIALSERYPSMMDEEQTIILNKAIKAKFH